MNTCRNSGYRRAIRAARSIRRATDRASKQAAVHQWAVVVRAWLERME